jgi:hypothetical protein
LTFLSYELVSQENTHACAACGTMAPR